jgi:LmbE family N-acetylglucosaminyl deacetylase
VAANEPGQPGLSSTSAARIASVDLPTPERALAVGAHPDDIEFGCGGTLAKWAGAGCIINHVVCTDGSKGTWDPKADIAALVVTRQQEQRRAAVTLGGSGDVVFLGWPDGELESGLRQRWELAYWIRKIRPDVVLGHDPWKRYRLHPDHRQAGYLVCDAVVAARDPHFFPEQELTHHRPECLLLWEADEPDHAEDVSTVIDVKLAALEAHRSQFESTMKASDEAELASFRDRIRRRLADNGGLAGFAAAELFKRIADL